MLSTPVHKSEIQATLLWPELQTALTNGFLIDKQKPKPVNHWHELVKAINEALVEARHNPETARSLFALASWGRCDPAVLKQLRAIFTKEEISLEFLSHYEPEAPFAFHRLNDGLCDKF